MGGRREREKSMFRMSFNTASYIIGLESVYKTITAR